MREKKKTILWVVLIVCCSILTGFIIRNRINQANIDSTSTFRQTPKSSLKPEYIVYPTITPINITHNDNISLYSSSGDGLSWDTAYVIENFTVYNSSGWSMYVEGTNQYLIIRNFQIFSRNSSFVLRIGYSSNIRIQNATFISLNKNLPTTSHFFSA